MSLDEFFRVQAIIEEQSPGAQFLEENKNMQIVDPPKPPRQAAGTNLNFPRNLEEARSRIESLSQEIAQLKAGSAASPAKPASTPASPKAKAQPAADPTYPATGTPGGNRPNTNEMAVNFKAPPLALLPADADCPTRIQKYLDAMTESEVRDCLRGEHNALRLGMAYKELQKRKTLTAIG